MFFFFLHINTHIVLVAIVFVGWCVLYLIDASLRNAESVFSCCCCLTTLVLMFFLLANQVVYSWGCVSGGAGNS